MRTRCRVATVAVFSLAVACGDDAGSGGASSSPKATSTSGSGTGGETASSSASSSASSATSSGQGSSTSSGAGGEDPWAGPLVHLTELDLGTAEIGDAIIFPVPDRAIGLTTFSQTPENGAIGILQLRPPNSSSVVTQFEIPGTDYPFFVNEHAIAAASPQSDLAEAWPVLEGNWRLRLAADDAAAAASSVFVRRTNDGAFHGGVVDINVLIAPGSGTDAAEMVTVLTQMFTGYWQPGIGLGVGTVTYQSLASSYDTVDSADELAQMFASSAGVGPAPAVNLFVVGDFDFVSALGIAGGIPAAPMVHGTERSGVAYTPTGNTGYDASILAHEIGHMAGLFHTSEIQVTAFDPLGDTLTCPNIMNMNPQNCPDAGNVMFPIAYGGTSFSPLQARVVQGSAVYRGVIEAGGLPGDPLPLISAPPSAPRPLVAPTYRLPRTATRVPATPLERTLAAHWCDRVSDIEGYVLGALAPDAAALTAVVHDGALPDHARGRALRLLARVDERAAVETAADALARGCGRRVRLAAIRVLDRLAPGELASLAERGRPYDDPVIEARLDRLGLRP